MTPRQAFEQIHAYAKGAAAVFPASSSLLAIQAICQQMLAGEDEAPGGRATFWAAWHPQHGFEVPHQYEGAVAYADLDPVARAVRELNADDKTTNRNGWRATKVNLAKVIP